MAAIEAFAPAKINLTLHVTGQRADGYHLLDSLVVFANIGDTVSVTSAAGLRLEVLGPMAAGVPADESNLVLRAARFLQPEGGARITLTKHLPAASGIGGGSSDAAASLRALAALWQVPLPLDVSALGADVPVCMVPQAMRLRGIGEDLTPVPGLPACDILLVNPGVAVSTPAVFAALTRRCHPPMAEALPIWRDAAALAHWLRSQRNDLQAASIRTLPVITEVLARLQETGCLFAGMSGSGATCFALFAPGDPRARQAQARIAETHPEWWVRQGRLL